MKKKGFRSFHHLFARDKGEALSAARNVLQRHGQIIIKPSVSATAELTFRVSDAAAISEAVEAALTRGEVIIQPFISSIVDSGELSLIYLNCGGSLQFSHAVQKCAHPGDFRVQSDFGGTTNAFDVPTELIEIGYRSLRVLKASPLYARVDIVDWQIQPRIGELELIEPELFFRFSQSAASRFADAIIEADE